MILSLLAATLWVVGFVSFIGQVPKQTLGTPISQDKASLGVVLTGGQGRIIHGLIKLYEGRVPQLLITGVNENTSNKQLFANTGNPLGSRLYERFQKRIHIGRKARSTRGNALEVKEFLKGKPRTKSIMLITTNYHMPRSLHEFRRVLPDSYRIIAEPAFSPKFPADWWRNKDSALLLVSEYHKLAISYVMKLVAQETKLSEILADNPL
ncbi:MAG: YdcF family protein [Rickettsiales bacterium]|nr:YdcF family protein [Rickettsiales bacterium]